MSAPLSPCMPSDRTAPLIQLPAEFDGDAGRMTIEKLLWYDSPLGGDYQQ